MPTIEHNINLDNITLGIKKHVRKHKVSYAFAGGLTVGLILRSKQTVQTIVNVTPI